MLRPLAKALIIASFAPLALWPSASPELTTLQKIRLDGELKVATRHNPASYYHGQNGPTGFDYQLARRFANYLGVDLRVTSKRSPGALREAVTEGQVQVAAVNLAAQPGEAKHLSFTTGYQEVSSQLIYRRDAGHPDNVDELTDDALVVAAKSVHAARLREMKKVYPALQWRSLPGVSARELLRKLQRGEFDYTVVSSNVFDLQRTLFPDLNAAFDMGSTQELGWAMTVARRGDGLRRAAEAFLDRERENGKLASLKRQFFDHRSQFNYVGAKKFIEHMKQRLPQYLPSFRKAARRQGLDWRLLAAVGYQESLWNPEAVSPTGVRGLMMLTRATAREVGVEHRTRAKPSIFGGARYLRKLRRRLPESIREPDRTWLALASYNAGYGHVLDARRITHRQGDDPNDWFDVRTRLPMLMNPQWYRRSRHGYARGGRQALHYVQNVRRYYELLLWATKSERLMPRDTQKVALRTQP